MRKRGKKTLMESAADLAESVLPALESAMETAVETAKDTVDKAGPILADGKAIAQEKARKGRRRAAAKLAALKEAEPAAKVAAFKAAEPEPEKKGGKLKKLVLIGGLVAIGNVVAKRLRGAPSKSNWQSSYTPQPAPRHSAEPAAPAAKAPAPPPVEEPAAADDLSGASPDEAMADRADEPHPDTTPDNPAEVVELRPVEEPVEEPAEEPAASEETPAPARKKG